MTDPTPTPEDQARATAFLERSRGFTERGKLIALTREFARTRSEEREACAKVCDDAVREHAEKGHWGNLIPGAVHCAAKIRARGAS